ncbi:nuclear transport factor 2 family protein [Flavobacterium sp. ANB]|uniref:nuclear transport factor 2 family protein n=1 Tax=unclassified Flavobacterium TaxID=196869 RepID=UPI0012B70E3F|nr:MULTISPECIES: nuclear transport factor 2 family protein [unclassified Flavobacterium]MBF4517449.1 nuclear transport factor 2 family protein [Flavobacterium sp. ANB]MTD70825.1 DUF4440 domain-containing protein [Flavobacterium sp. LC2016-13]
MKNNKSFFRLKAILIGILLFQFHIGFSQEEKNSELYKTIISKDSLLFNIGFNTCDISQFENLISDDFEFYHDIDGISDKTLFLSNLKKGICLSGKSYHVRRDLIAGSTEIYPLTKNGTLYGALQTGIHQFFEVSTGQKDKAGSTAKFTHVWLLQNGVWKLTRSFSYDHQMKKKNPKTK